MGSSAPNSNGVPTSENLLNTYCTKGETQTLQDIIPPTTTMEEQTFHDLEDPIDGITHVPDDQINKLDKELADFQAFMEKERIAEEVVPVVHSLRKLLKEGQYGVNTLHVVAHIVHKNIMTMTEFANTINNLSSPNHTQVSTPIPTTRMSTFTSSILTTNAQACSNATTSIGVSNWINSQKYKVVGFNYQNLAPRVTSYMNNHSQPPLTYNCSQPHFTYNYSQPPFITTHN